MSISRIVTIIVIVVVVLAGVQWFMNSRPTAYFNAYGSDTATTTATSTQDSSNSAATINSQTTTNQTPAASSAAKNFMHTVTLVTSKGRIVFETYDADAPKTVQNFITLTEKGFYNGLIFHRVIPGFMIQGGDPTGTGTGGPGYTFADELDPNTPSYKAGYVRGTVAMANSGPDTNGSQFFIMQKDTPLPNNYTIFGKVISGLDVVDAIAAVQRNSSDKPLTPVSMTKVSVVAK